MLTCIYNFHLRIRLRIDFTNRATDASIYSAVYLQLPANQFPDWHKICRKHYATAYHQ